MTYHYQGIISTITFIYFKNRYKRKHLGLGFVYSYVLLALITSFCDVISWLVAKYQYSSSSTF